MAIYNLTLYSNIEESHMTSCHMSLFIRSCRMWIAAFFLKDCSGVALNSEAENARFSALIHLFKG